MAYLQHWLNVRLPMGSSLDQARRLFETAHIEHGYDEKTHTLYAIEDVSSFLLVSNGVQVLCDFGDKGTLVACKTHVFADGP
jgi:hypothetical protein